MDELKPCPFCGLKFPLKVETVAEMEYMDKGSSGYKWASSHYTVVCNYDIGGCGASCGCNNRTKDAAIAEWNRRDGNG